MPKEEEKPKEIDVEDELLNSYKLDDDQKAAARVHAAARSLDRLRRKQEEQKEELEKKGKDTKHSGWKKFGS